MWPCTFQGWSSEDELQGGGWAATLKAMIPSYGTSLIDDAALTRRVRAETAAVLHLHDVQVTA